MKKYLFFTAILLAIYFIVAVYNTCDWDLWHRLAAGKLFFSLGHVPVSDIFAYTQTKELWIDHEWGSGVIFYFIADRFGEWGLGLLKCLLLFLTFLPVYLVNCLRTEEQGKYRILFYLFFLYAVLFGFVYTIRSHCFTYAFFAWWIYLIELVKRGNRRLLWLFPPMAVVWANLHGGFLAGLGILLLAGFPLTALGSGLLTIINPYGIRYWEYLADAVTMDRTFITEWLPLDMFGPAIIALGFKVFLVMTIVALPYLFKNKKWSELLILAVTCYLGLKHIRHNVFFVIASAAYIGEYYFSALKHYVNFMPEKVMSGLEKFKDVSTYTIILIAGILTVHFVPLKLNMDQTKFPVKSVEFIKKNDLSGNLLVLYNWGAYVLWNLYPQCKVAIDSRYEEVYPDSLVEQAARFQYLRKDWKDLMNNYKTDLMLIDTSYPVFTELLALDDWKVIYQDNVSAVFMPAAKAGNRQWIIPKDDFVIDSCVLKSKIGEQVDK